MATKTHINDSKETSTHRGEPWTKSLCGLLYQAIPYRAPADWTPSRGRYSVGTKSWGWQSSNCVECVQAALQRETQEHRSSLKKMRAHLRRLVDPKVKACQGCGFQYQTTHPTECDKCTEHEHAKLVRSGDVHGEEGGC